MSGEVQVERFTAAERTEDDAAVETTKQIRPQFFADYPGQERAKNNLITYVKAARLRDDVMDHVLLHGPPGLGKTTLGRIIANELGLPFFATSAPGLEKQGDLAGILASFEQRTTVFVDEIHRLPKTVEETLYSAMEDFALDLVVGQGQGARPLKMPIAEFTLVGATTRVSLLSRPLLSRFGIHERLEFYSAAELEQIVTRAARMLDIPINASGCAEISCRARGTPRIANRLLRRVWDFAVVAGCKEITQEITTYALLQLEIDGGGLDRVDRAILCTIRDRHHGGPVGIDTLSASIGEERKTIEEVYEPFLVYGGYLSRSPRGRVLTERGIEHIASNSSRDSLPLSSSSLAARPAAVC